MAALSIDIIPYFDDNFSYFLDQGEDAPTALIDCGDAGPVLDFLEAKNQKLDFVLATHSHYDHAGDIASLLEAFPDAKVIKPKGDTRITVPGQEAAGGDLIHFGSHTIQVIAVPAHTQFCVSYLIDNNLFSGDTLFSGGCGRLFEGTPQNLESAMDALSSLPNDTNVYFGHEYTVSNLKFALTIEPTNQKLIEYIDRATFKTENGQFTTPSTIGLEKEINPFFRIDQEAVITEIDPKNELSRTERLAELRSRKDHF